MLVVWSVAASGCGSDGASPSNPATGLPSSAPATSAVPTSSPLDSRSLSPSEAPTPSETIDDPGGETDPPSGDETDKPPVLDKGVSGRVLTTANFFSAPDDWVDGRFNVAGQQDLAGVGGPLSGCRDAADEGSPTIELRLANNFTEISMKVGQGDDSPSSDVEVNVKLVGNGRYIDTVRVPFNKIQTLQASVAGVNALKIQTWMSGDECDGNDEIVAVLMELRVE